ncbi:MAG: reverse transcriptase N-terminal domain-containing protein [Trichodesmium sp. St11_bin5]|nr:reverse transcriptase N-terminal domain-containing protein [Trichodesmium sp. St11_bin5]
MELIKWKDINWKRVGKYVFKWQKLIYKASSGADICRMRNYQKLLTKSYYARLLTVRCVIQDNQGNKTAGIDAINKLSPIQRFHSVDLRLLKRSPTRRVTDTKTRMIRKMAIRHTKNV